jgi:CRP-like cAMP-binding protein
METIDYLREHPALSHLDAGQLANLEQICRVDDHPAGHELISRGEKGDCLYFLLKGRLEVSYSDDPSQPSRIEIEAPCVVGEIELLTEESRTATVRCASDAKLLALPYAPLRERILSGDPAALKLIVHISRVLALRLARTIDRFAHLESGARPVRRDELDEFRKTLFSDWTL